MTWSTVVIPGIGQLLKKVITKQKMASKSCSNLMARIKDLVSFIHIYKVEAEILSI